MVDVIFSFSREILQKYCFFYFFQLFSALTDEIKRLSRILEEFDRPFSAESSDLVIFKKVTFIYFECTLLVWNALSTYVSDEHS